MFRIRSEKTTGKASVMFFHGVIDSSDAWICNTVENSHAFFLADKGYDVWLPNARGNKYSRGHIKYNADYDSEYWNQVTVTKIAEFDLPSFIKFIKNETKVDKLTFIGHS
jgi:pimeloyl-ACP methyl ester carboxylesterase